MAAAYILEYRYLIDFEENLLEEVLLQRSLNIAISNLHYCKIYIFDQNKPRFQLIKHYFQKFFEDKERRTAVSCTTHIKVKMKMKM